MCFLPRYLGSMGGVKLHFGEVDIGKQCTVVMDLWQSTTPADQKVGMLISDRGGNFLVNLVAPGSVLWQVFPISLSSVAIF